MSEPTPSTRRYWRSVDRLLDSPAVREELARELPPGALEAPDEVTRRGVLQLLSASFGLAGLAACRRPVEHIVPYVEAPVGVTPGVPQRYATTLPLGTDVLGVLVEAHEGRPTKVEGNPLHPTSHGAASALAQAAVLGLYDPDRAASVTDGGQASERAAFEAWWAERATALAAGAGAGLAVLASPFASPTLARLARALLAAYPSARWLAWGPVSDEAVFAGHADRRPVYHLERARVALALDCDLLLTESNAVHNAWGFAAARRPERSEGMLRLYAVESVLSLTGANADHRLALAPALLPAFLAAVARELGVATVAGAPLAALPAAHAARARVVARDLRSAGSAGLVAVGRCQPAAMHALALAINEGLGSVGNTLTLHPLDDVASGTTAELAALADAMRAGSVDTLVVLGGNPVYDAPADLDLAAALAAVPNTVCLSTHRHETAAACRWHLPAAHPLEAWGDARSADGTASVVQPLIAPLLGGISPVELLAMLAGGPARPGHEVVRETWSGAAPDEAAWRRVLHDGLGTLPGSGPVRAGAGAPVIAGAVATEAAAATSDAAPASAPSPATASDATPGGAAPATSPAPPLAGEGIPLPVAESPAAPAGEGDRVDLVLRPSPVVWDGSFANDAWLQELPHPLSKLTWDNAAYLSPATAERLGVASGERVLITAGGQRVAMPALVLPGVADGTVVVELGYGRQAAGRVGNGVGGDAYRLRNAASPWLVTGAVVRPTWGGHEPALTQTHWELEGRSLIREATLAEYRHHPEFAHDPVHEVPQLWEPPVDWESAPGPQWAMGIDLTSCIGCNACVVACQSENNVPVVGREQVRRTREMHWLRVDRYFTGDPAEPEVRFQPVPCMHCENAPCEQVCPVAATVHDHQGLNQMVYNRCIGTRYCSNNCPYKVRRFNFFNYTKDTPELLAMAANPDVTVRSRGVMEKCTYCVQRIVEGRQAAKAEGRSLADGEVKTACQQTCPTQAIVFGDLKDPASALVARKALPRDYVLLGELNNRPRTSYQAKVRNPNPEWV
jgi:molybdopterin-containing oxidoreductase family iron-sulfur binding subunit